MPAASRRSPKRSASPPLSAIARSIAAAIVNDGRTWMSSTSAANASHATRSSSSGVRHAFLVTGTFWRCNSCSTHSFPAKVRLTSHPAGHGLPSYPTREQTTCVWSWSRSRCRTATKGRLPSIPTARKNVATAVSQSPSEIRSPGGRAKTQWRTGVFTRWLSSFITANSR